MIWCTSDKNASCDCTCVDPPNSGFWTKFLCQDMVCKGPQTNLSQTVAGKPWIVYIHGGEWAECTNINEYLPTYDNRPF